MILMIGSRADDGIQLSEIASVVFSSISMIYLMATLFKINHNVKWYKKIMKEDNVGHSESIADL